MPPPLDVNREAVKTLALSVGVREAARQTGLKEDVVLQWSKRFQWFKQPEPTPQPPTIQKQPVIGVIKPSEALKNAMNGRKEKCRVLFSKYVVNAAKVASRSNTPLRDAEKVHKAASVMSIIWPEEKSGSSNMVLNLGVAINTRSSQE